MGLQKGLADEAGPLDNLITAQPPLIMGLHRRARSRESSASVVERSEREQQGPMDRGTSRLLACATFVLFRP
eukprot:scaffold28371_cov93-Skeletonema_dohrnii-CCMP3373.AAC.2